MKNLEIYVQNHDYATYVTLEGNLTQLDALKLKAYLPTLVSNGLPLHVNLNKVEEIDLTGLNALLMTKLVCNRSKSDLFVSAPDDHGLYKLLHLTKFKNQFEFRNSLVSKPTISIAS